MKIILKKSFGFIVLFALQNIAAQELVAWKKQSVSYNGYERYGVLFDPSIPWSKKVDLAEQKPSKTK